MSYYYPEEYYKEISFDCKDCEEPNDDIEVLVSNGTTVVTCEHCNYVNNFEIDDD